MKFYSCPPASSELAPMNISFLVKYTHINILLRSVVELRTHEGNTTTYSNVARKVMRAREEPGKIVEYA